MKRTGWVLACLAALPLPAPAETLSFLSPEGPVAAAQAWHFWFVIVVMMIVVLPVFLLTPLILWRYRYGRARGDYRPDWSFAWVWEVLLWGVPVLIVVVLGVALWRETLRLDPFRPIGPDPLRVEVVGYDWKWLFIYPDLGIATVDRLELPAARPVSIRLTSDTVMQSLFIPALGSQIYAMQGMQTKLHLKADRPGTFLGENTQYNGDGFHRQHFTVTALEPAEFAAWAERQRADALTLTPAAIHALETDGTAKDMASGLHLASSSDLVFAVPAGLFDRILHDGPAAPAPTLLADTSPAPSGKDGP